MALRTDPHWRASGDFRCSRGYGRGRRITEIRTAATACTYDVEIREHMHLNSTYLLTVRSRLRVPIGLAILCGAWLVRGSDDVSATCSRSTVIIQYSCASAAHCYGVSGLNTQWIYQRVYGVRMFVPMSANLENMILSHPRPLVTSMFHRAPYQFVVC